MANLKHLGTVALIVTVAAGPVYLNPFSGGGLASIGGAGLADGEVTACEGIPLEISGAERELLELHNEVRAEHGAPELCYQENLAGAAEGHSEDMLERDYFAHESPDGREPAARMLDAGYGQDGYRSWQVAENLYKAEGTGAAPGREAIEGAVEGWLESPGHRENLLDPGLREVGSGVASTGFAGTPEKTALYTTNFGTRVR